MILLNLKIPTRMTAERDAHLPDVRPGTTYEERRKTLARKFRQTPAATYATGKQFRGKRQWAVCITAQFP